MRDDPREFVAPINFILNPLQPFKHLIADSATLAWDGLGRLVNLGTAQDKPLLERIVQLFDFTSFVSLEPFRQTVNETVWFQEIRQSEKELLIITTNWELGDVRTYDKHDMTDQLGPSIILGSSAIPGIFPPVPVGSQSFVDGGVLLNTPLEPAIEAGANVLHVISVFPDVEKIPLATMSNTLAIMYRQQIISWTRAVERDIRRAWFVNKDCKFVALASEAMRKLRERISGPGLWEELRLEEIEQYVESQKDCVLVTVHHYNHDDDISEPLGLLNFDRNRIEGLIERGFEDTVDHDCVRNKCVIP